MSDDNEAPFLSDEEIDAQVAKEEVAAYPWLESDDEFEGIGAHHDNPRYTPVDEDEYDSVTGVRLDNLL